MATASHTPLYFRLVLRLLRPFPDFDFGFIKPVRARAVELLQLREGQRVLDVGCGPGGSFPFLRAAVGSTGAVVGVEISAEVAALAQRRIEQNSWSNVQLQIAPAETVALNQQFDGLHMFGAPDVFASESALANLLPHLLAGARVVFFGAKTSAGRFGWVLNPFLRLAFPKLTFATTPVPDAEPWKPLAPHLSNFTVHELFFGWMFLASGTLIAASSGPASARGSERAAGVDA
jgi:demethylmenaquinone methyltransferase/2-methoxy-6-polyprenyl-1,4-benzoquinol methylase